MRLWPIQSQNDDNSERTGDSVDEARRDLSRTARFVAAGLLLGLAFANVRAVLEVAVLGSAEIRDRLIGKART